eukprot:CAMPEP_0169385848 /NCGR_PEP_ID=MMETSP1017-20121227/44344_1 /TAXON_ID=342587 /ORGANISM="Karlodinium micrum, Strain CCMP2283" /LENGTH=68 /DNA_ID=CAMNT_0009486829 /DNA_START=88 /DNA_END=291 /DNA_ORIENTATION=+
MHSSAEAVVAVVEVVAVLSEVAVGAAVEEERYRQLQVEVVVVAEVVELVHQIQNLLHHLLLGQTRQLC